MSGKRAAGWIRVSSGTQDESTQIPVIESACAGRGLTVVRWFRLHDVSASKGAQQAEQNAAVAAMAAGEFDVLVCTESDRLDRRGPRAAYAFMWALEIAAGHPDVLLAVNDPMFGRDDIGSEVLSTVRMAAARDEIALKRRRITDKFRAMDDAGAFRGQPPFGYSVEGEKYAKRLVPGPRAQDVRDAFADAARMSTVKLGQRLGLTPDAVAKILRSKVYSAGVYEVKRADGVTAVHRCEPLVKPAVQARAVAALEARHTGDNVTSRALAKDDFSGALFCPCGARTGMHRYYGGSKIRKDGTREPKVRRYQCNPKSGGCGKSVRADNADAAVNAFMSGRAAGHYVQTWVDGDDCQAGLDRVQLELRELSGRGLDDDAEDSERTRLRAERKRLEALPREQGHYELDFSGMTEGQQWDRLVTSERRAWLVSGEFRIYAVPEPGRTGDVTVELEYTVDTEAGAA